MIGVAPEGTLVDIRAGIIEHGQFSARATFEFRGTGYLNTVQDGFIVGKAGHGGQVLAIVAVGPDHGALFSPCHGARTMVFTAQAGKVIYLGNVLYSFPTLPGAPGGRVSASYSEDFAAAREYLESHYPKLANKLVPAKAEMLPADESCIGIP